jgi:hypothetical protein
MKAPAAITATKTIVSFVEIDSCAAKSAISNIVHPFLTSWTFIRRLGTHYLVGRRAGVGEQSVAHWETWRVYLYTALIGGNPAPTTVTLQYHLNVLDGNRVVGTYASRSVNTKLPL